MGKNFTPKTTIFKHNVGYSIHPHKALIESMGWKVKDKLTVVPIPEKGILILKGKKVKEDIFLNRFYLRLLKNMELRKVKRVKNRIASLINTFSPLDIITYSKPFQEICRLEDQFEKILAEWNNFLINEEIMLRKSSGI